MAAVCLRALYRFCRPAAAACLASGTRRIRWSRSAVAAAAAAPIATVDVAVVCDAGSSAAAAACGCGSDNIDETPWSHWPANTCALKEKSVHQNWFCLRRVRSLCARVCGCLCVCVEWELLWGLPGGGRVV